MTFEQFVISYTGRDLQYHKQAGTTGIEFAKAAWNAAIEAAIDVADTKVGLSDKGMWLLEGLKTPLEAPETDEVGDTMPHYDWKANKWVVKHG